MASAKVFWKGDCQVVCLPEDIPFPPDIEGMLEDFERPPQVRQT